MGFSRKGIGFMNLGRYLSSMIKPELENLKEICHFTDDEEIVFNELSKGRSRTYIAEKNAWSCSTVSNKIKSIQNKISKAEKE